MRERVFSFEDTLSESQMIEKHYIIILIVNINRLYVVPSVKKEQCVINLSIRILDI